MILSGVKEREPVVLRGLAALSFSRLDSTDVTRTKDGRLFNALAKHKRFEGSL